jgi:drug/metabolite transporter (DMT)-like permease
MNWFFFCALSVFALAVAELTQQYLLNRKGFEIDERVSGFLTFFIPACLMAPFVFIYYRAEVFLLMSPIILPYFLGACIAGAFGTTFYLRSFKVESISYSVILVSSSAIFSTILGIFVFHETSNLLKFSGIFMILLAIFLSNVKNEKFQKASLWGLAAGFFYGTMYVFDKFLVLEVDPFVYIFWSFLFTSTFLFLRNPMYIFGKITDLRIVDVKNILISGIAYLIYNLFTFLSYIYGGEVGKVDAINNSQIFLIILFEIVVLKQQQNVFRKLGSFLLAIIGIYILSSF